MLGRVPLVFGCSVPPKLVIGCKDVAVGTVDTLITYTAFPGLVSMVILSGC